MTCSTKTLLACLEVSVCPTKRNAKESKNKKDNLKIDNDVVFESDKHASQFARLPA